MRCAFMMIAASLILCGCRKDPYLDAHLEMMGAERRAIEDRLFDMEYQYEKTSKRLKDLQSENERLRKKLGISGGSDEDDLQFPELSPPEVSEGELGLPQIELPGASEGAELMPLGERTHSISRLGSVDPRITHIVINRRGTRGVDMDNEPGDDGLSVVVEPRNESGEIVPLAGPLTLVVLDYAKRQQGEEARVARWDLSADAVKRFMEASPAGEGIQLELPWPDKAPDHRSLRLDVRYETMDGRKLDARRDVTIRLGPDFSQRWTPRSNSSVANQPDSTSSGSGGRTAESPEESTLKDRTVRPEWTPYR